MYLWRASELHIPRHLSFRRAVLDKDICLDRCPDGLALHYHCLLFLGAGIMRNSISCSICANLRPVVSGK